MAMRSNDRVFVLAKEKEVKDIGLLDPGLFDGKNNLHAVMNPDNCMWTFRYEHGIVPPILRQRYTSFRNARLDAERYFATKKITVVEIRD